MGEKSKEPQNQNPMERVLLAVYASSDDSDKELAALRDQEAELASATANIQERIRRVQGAIDVLRGVEKRVAYEPKAAGTDLVGLAAERESQRTVRQSS